MSESHQAAPGREALAPDAADALRAAAAHELHRAEELAAVLEDIAANGLPDPADCVPWVEIRDARIAEFEQQ